MTQQHTPIPWRAWPDGAITWGGTDNNDFVIAQVEMKSTSEEQGMADAHLIVQAVNAHDELLAACEMYHKAMDHLFARLIILDKDFFPSESGLPWDAIVKGKAARDKAKGG